MAAIALLYLNEEDAFWCVVAITECIMPPDYYSSTLTASQVLLLLQNLLMYQLVMCKLNVILEYNRLYSVLQNLKLHFI